MSTGVVLAVCAAGDDVILEGIGPSAIDKRPRRGRLDVDELGLVDDHVGNKRHHGGVDQAVYAYADPEARRWADELGRELPYGWFGENLRIDGMAVTDAVVGERWEVGTDGLVVSNSSYAIHNRWRSTSSPRASSADPCVSAPIVLWTL